VDVGDWHVLEVRQRNQRDVVRELAPSHLGRHAGHHDPFHLDRPRPELEVHRGSRTDLDRDALADSAIADERDTDFLRAGWHVDQGVLPVLAGQSPDTRAHDTNDGRCQRRARDLVGDTTLDAPRLRPDWSGRGHQQA
jgi:hypothetical protein